MKSEFKNESFLHQQKIEFTPFYQKLILISFFFFSKNWIYNLVFELAGLLDENEICKK